MARHLGGEEGGGGAPASTAGTCVYPPVLPAMVCRKGSGQARRCERYCGRWEIVDGESRGGSRAADGRQCTPIEALRWCRVDGGTVQRLTATADGNGRHFVHRRTAADRLSGGRRASLGNLWEEALKNGVSDRGIHCLRVGVRLVSVGCVCWGKLSTTQLIHFTNPTLPPPSTLSFSSLRPSRMTRPTRRLKFA